MKHIYTIDEYQKLINKHLADIDLSKIQTHEELHTFFTDQKLYVCHYTEKVYEDVKDTIESCKVQVVLVEDRCGNKKYWRTDIYLLPSNHNKNHSHIPNYLRDPITIFSGMYHRGFKILKRRDEPRSLTTLQKRMSDRVSSLNFKDMRGD